MVVFECLKKSRSLIDEMIIQLGLQASLTVLNVVRSIMN